jgi:hypothetical protein
MPDNINPHLYARGYGSGSSSYAPTKDNGSCCPPVCADCGLLECLCRPRFFAGQLLTEQDLNRLDAYVRAKNRLHTLQLHGYGVVNGLEVRCEPCGSGVVVTTGYAISPCGDDIIVCCDTSVDVCALIKKCRPVDDTCRPFAGTNAKDCAELIEDWVLAIRYTENPARGVAALRMGPTCSCGASHGACSCGQTQATCGRCGKSSVNCRCGGKKNACGCGKPAASCSCGTTSTVKPRAMPAECEPTVLCEGYAFDVCLAPVKKKQDPREGNAGNAITGALLDRFLCCIQDLGDTLPDLPGPPTTQSFQQNPQAWNLWCCQTKQAMIAYFTEGPGSDCTLAEQLSKVLCPDPNDQNFANEMSAVITALGIPLLEAILACFCHALLPPAPCGTTEDRIPLAVVRVRKRDCKVVSVCNFTPLRKTVITFPTLAYWLSWIPLGSALSDLIHQLCCTPLFQRDQTPDEPPVLTARRSLDARDTATVRANPAPSADVLAREQTFAALVKSAVARGAAPVDPKDIVGGLLGLDFGGTQPLSNEERANAPVFLMLNQVLRPIATSLLAAAQPTLRAPAAPAKETDALKERIAKLEEDIKKLKKKR